MQKISLHTPHLRARQSNVVNTVRKNSLSKWLYASKLKSLAVGVAFFGLGACGNTAATTGIKYNEGLAESYNSVLLMNIVRAAKRYPLYYSALGDYSADFGAEFDFDPDIEIPFGISADDEGIEVSVSPSVGVSSDVNANATSLETEDFIVSMNTRLSDQTLLFFTQGRNRGSLSLILMVLVNRMAVTQSEYRQTLSLAKETCQEKSGRLSIESQGICRDLESYQPPNKCPDHLTLLRNAPFASFKNDPTNICEFASFKYFVEALRVAEPQIVISDDTGLNFVLDPARSNVTLFSKDKTGIELRSPHETIGYLGEIVRQNFLGLDDGVLTLAAPDGSSAPIFLLNEGSSREAAISAKVDGENYWIPKQDLKDASSHFSFMAMSIVKDVVSLNTSDSQLPASSTRVVIE